MKDKNMNESSTPDVPKSSSSKGKSRKPQHKKKKEGNMVTIVSSYISSTEEIKTHIFTT